LASAHSVATPLRRKLSGIAEKIVVSINLGGVSRYIIVVGSPVKRAHHKGEMPWRRLGLRSHWWSDSSIRTPSRQALLRMLESKDHQKILILVELWI
jgi:hypothetical protein